MNIYRLLLKYPSGQSFFRAVATVSAVILATLIILTTLSLGQGWIARDQKANLATNLFPATTSAPTDDIQNPVYFSTYDTEFNSLPIKEIGIRKTNPSDILPGGLTAPSDNELWVTPGLKRLIDTNPTLTERYARYDVKASFPSGLAPSPDSLMLLYQIPEENLSTENSQIQAVSSEELWNRYNRQAQQNKDDTTIRLTVPLLAGVIIITPVLLLIAEIARIGIVQREKRYAALSLAGATRTQIRLFVAMETLPLSLFGSILGIAIFIFVGMPILINTPLGDSTIWLTDLNLSLVALFVVGIVIVICSVLAGLQSVSPVKISPLAVTRTLGDIKKPSFLSVIPLLVGVAGLSALAAFGRSWYKDNQEFGTYIIIGLVLAIILGIFVAGPYLTRSLSHVLLRLPRGGSMIMAAHRIRSVSRKEFHSISGIILALFVGALLMTMLATIQATGSKYQTDQASIAENGNPLQNPLQVSVLLPPTGSDQLIKNLERDTELSTLTSNRYIQKSFIENYDVTDESATPLAGSYYESCTVFTQRTGLSCDNNIQADSPFIVTLQLAHTAESEFAQLKPQFTSVSSVAGTITDDSYVLVAKDHQSLGRIVDRVYNITSDYHLKSGAQISIDYTRSNDGSSIAAISGLEKLTVIILVIAMLTGGLSLLTNVTGGIFERKRTFIRLRALGAGIGALARSLSIEVLAPLCALSILVVGLGIFSCYCLLSIIGAFSDGYIIFSLPSTALWLGLVATIILCVLVSLLNIPVLSKLINFDEMRSE